MASLLKLYLRELPEPVVPFVFYDSFRNATKCELTVHTFPHNTLNLPSHTVFLQHVFAPSFCTHLRALFLHTPSHHLSAHTFTPSFCAHLHTLFLHTPSHPLSAHTFTPSFCAHLHTLFLHTPSHHLSAHTFTPSFCTQYTRRTK